MAEDINFIEKVITGAFAAASAVASGAWFAASTKKEHDLKIEQLESKFKDFEQRDFLTRSELELEQESCRRHINDTILLALERHGRETDKKFTTICLSLNEIKMAVNSKSKVCE